MIRYALICSGVSPSATWTGTFSSPSCMRGHVPGVTDDDDHFAIDDDRLPEPELLDRGGHFGDSRLIFPGVTGVRDHPFDGP